MTTLLKPRIDACEAEQVIRRNFGFGDDNTLRLHESATAWINTVLADSPGRPAEAVLADITAVMTALNAAEDEVYVEQGWYDDEPDEEAGR